MSLGPPNQGFPTVKVTARGMVRVRIGGRVVVRDHGRGRVMFCVGVRIRSLLASGLDMFKGRLSHMTTLHMTTD